MTTFTTYSPLADKTILEQFDAIPDEALRRVDALPEGTSDITCAVMRFLSLPTEIKSLNLRERLWRTFSGLLFDTPKNSLPTGTTREILRNRVERVAKYIANFPQASIYDATNESIAFPYDTLPYDVREAIKKGERNEIHSNADHEVYDRQVAVLKNEYGNEFDDRFGNISFDALVDLHLETHPLPEGYSRDGAGNTKAMTSCMQVVAFKAELRATDDYGMDAINGLVPNPNGTLSLADQLRAFKSIVAKSAFHFFGAVKDEGIQTIFQESFDVFQNTAPENRDYLAAYSRFQGYLKTHNVTIAEITTSDPEIRVIPKEITSINGLTTLNLAHAANLQYLPTNFGGLRALKELYLNGSQIQALPDSFGNLRALKALDLDGSQIQALPDSFGDLRALYGLCLQNAPIQVLPASFGNLIALKALDLDGSQIQALPDSFGNLTSLEQLLLNNTPIQALPASFGNLVALKTLQLNNTPIQALPDSFGDLVVLTKLYLNNTPIQALPDSFGDLVVLKGLYLEDTQIQALSDSFGDLRALRALNLDGTPIQALPDSFGDLRALTMLYLRNTQIQVLPDSFGNLTSLEQLLLNNTPIQALPDSFGNLRALTELMLQNAPIQALPDSFANLINLDPDYVRIDPQVDRTNLPPHLVGQV